MNLNENWLYAKFDKKVQFGSESADMKGDLLFCWPYAWDETTNWNLINQAVSSLTSWFESILPSQEVPLEVAQSMVIFAFYTSPDSWRKNAPENPNEFQKLLLHAKFLQALFTIDDHAESQSESIGHGKYLQTIGRLVYKILRYDIETVEEMKVNPMYLTIIETSIDCASAMELLFDAAQELKNHFGVTKEVCKDFARMAHYLFEHQTWCGTPHTTHLLNQDLCKNLRLHTGGTCLVEELIFLMERIYIPRAVRDNFYWSRCYKVIGYLPCRTNDIIGIEKEWVEQRQYGKRVDNTVFLYMETKGLTFGQALAESLAEHNIILMELHDLLQFLHNNHELLHELNTMEKEIFFSSLKAMESHVAYNVQAQLLMPRYNCGMKLSFEKLKTGADCGNDETGA